KDMLQAPLATVAIPRDVVVFTHAVLLDGQLIGHWRHVRKRNSVVVETSFYKPLDRLEAQALDAAVERYGRFMGVPAALL
ncbi:MAG: winged helix DNA-binding domain-containing protein, partial [Actinomycetota bacterium]|nr:winged helix DNA-binding domain-containing protein [Actinomycetota bacterium]